MRQSFYILFFIFLIQQVSASGQNLVPNPGFEDSVVCQQNPGTCRPEFWYSPTMGTPDYFLVSSPGNSGCIDELTNRWGGGGYQNNWGYQLPHLGGKYVGFGLASLEYISIELKDSLVAGKKYCVEAYVSLANKSGSGIDLIQFVFTNTKLTRYDTINGNTYPLDTVNPNASNSSGNIILDTTGWYFINLSFVAVGGERFLTIGNFQDSQTQYLVNDSSVNPGFVYYYFDDISVYFCDSISPPPEPPFSEITLNPNPTSGEIILKGNFPEGTKFEVYDMLGQIVFEKYLDPGDRSEQLFLFLADGMYSWRVEAGGAVFKNGKLIIAD